MTDARVIFISGWGSTSAIWQPLLNRLPELTPRFVDWSDCLDPIVQGRTLESIWAQMQTPCLLAGWSLGALLALRAAVLHPDRITGLVLISGTARMTSDRDYPGAAPAALRAMRARLGRDAGRVARDFAASASIPDGNSETEGCYLEQFGHFTSSQLAAGLDCLAGLDMRESLPGISHPALLLHGDSDAIISAGSARYLEENLPCARLCLLAGHSHLLPLTVPEEIAGEIRSFLK